MPPPPRIRRATAADEAAIASICLVTGADGGDATGLFSDDTALADVYATPYLHAPDCHAWVVDVAGRARGYVVAAVDTAAFQQWFIEEWWPRRSPAHAISTERDEWLLPEAANPDRLVSDAAADFPAHLHIDLLPELQGAGWGRRLIDTLMAQLADEGVQGVHLVATKANTAAQAFYPKVGFDHADEDDKTVTFTRATSAGR